MAFAFVVLACGVFSPSLSAGFQSDDLALLHTLRTGGPFSVWSGRGSTSPGFFRPLISASLWWDATLRGTRAFGFHATNLLAHAANAVLVALIAAELLADATAATLAGLLFLVSPTHAESVAWVVGRTDLLAATCGLAAFLAYLSWVRRGKVARAYLALALLLVGLCAKESLICLPLVVAAHAALPAPIDEARRARIAALVSIAVIPLYAVARRIALGEWVGGYGSHAHLSHNPINLATSAIGAWIWSLGLSRPDPGLLPLAATVLLIASLAGTAVVAVPLLRRRDRLAVFLVVAFYLALLPGLNLLYSFRGHEGERFLYLASAFPATLLAHALRPSRERRLGAALAVALLVASTMIAVGRAQIWQRASALATEVADALAAQPSTHPKLLLGLPDSLGDAFVLRWGLSELLLERHVDPTSVWTVATIALATIDAPVTTTTEGRHLELRTGSDARLAQFSPWPAVTIDAKDEHRLALTLAPTFEGDVWAWHDGRMVRLASYPR